MAELGWDGMFIECETRGYCLGCQSECMKLPGCIEVCDEEVKGAIPQICIELYKYVTSGFRKCGSVFSSFVTWFLWQARSSHGQY